MSFEDLKEVFVDTPGCDADKVTMEASLTDDLQAGSLRVGRNERHRKAVPDEPAGTQLSAEGSPQCRYRRTQLGAAAICRVQKMRAPCHAAGVGKKPVCLPKLRGASGNRRLLSAQHGFGSRDI